MGTYHYNRKYLAATPRNKRLTEEIQEAAQTGGVGGGMGYTGPQYWEMVTAKEDGTPLKETEYYLKPVGAPNVLAPGDVIAYAEGIEGLGLPVATYEMFGLFKAKLGGGLLYDETLGWYIDPKIAGSGIATNVKWGKVVAGESAELTIDTTTYPLALATHTHKDYLTWKSTMDGYTKPSGYTPITATDTLMGAFGKLEAHFGDYVDRVTDQRINGVKTFQQTIYSEKDVVAYSEGVDGLGLPVGSYDQYGLVRIDNNTIKMDGYGRLYVNGNIGGGGTDVSWGSSANGYALLMVGSSPAKNVALEGHTHTDYVEIVGDTMTGDLTIKENIPALHFDEDGYGIWTLRGYTGHLQLRYNNALAAYFDGPNLGDLHIENTLYASGDVIAYSDGIDGLGLPVASYEQYGLTRIDNNTIKMDGYGRLYVNGDIGGGISSWNDLTDKPSVFPTNWDNVDGKPTAFTPASHSHDEYVLKSNTGWGTVYQNNTADLSIKGVSKCVALDGYNPLLKEFVHINTKGTTFLSKGNNLGVKLSGGNGILGYDSTSPNNLGNLYMNYLKVRDEESSKDIVTCVKITPSSDILASGDVIAYAEGVDGLGLPVASYEQYGLARIDNNTIKMDSNGRLYANVSGGGGGSSTNCLLLSGGTMTGSITINGDDSIGLYPSRTNYNSIGSDTLRWYRGYINNFYTKGIHYYGNDSDDYVLLAGGGVKAVSSFGGGGSGTPIPGPRGQGVDYQWSGTSLRLGTIDSDGNITWGSYVNLQGPQGDPGGGGGSTNSLSSEVKVPGTGTRFQKSGTNIGVYISGGNTINGWHDTSSQNIGNLYFNYYNGDKNVKIDTNCKIYSNANIITSDMRLKDKLADVTGVLDSLTYINAFIYTLKADEDRIMKIGLSAQDVKKVFPQAVTLNYQDNCTEAYYGIDYAQVLTAVAVNGLKELYNKHLSLEQRVTKLEGGAA